MKKIVWSSVLIGGVAGLVAYRMGLLDRIIGFFSKKDKMNADFITSGAPPSAMIRRNEGSVSQVMTDVQLLGGQAVGQNMTNYGVSDASGLNGNTNNPAVEAYIDRSTVISFGQNYNGRSVGLN